MLTNIFQMGWNHQLVMHLLFPQNQLFPHSTLCIWQVFGWGVIACFSQTVLHWPCTTIFRPQCHWWICKGDLLSKIWVTSQHIITLEVQRLFFEWFFRKDYCFSRDLQSTIQGDYSFYGLWLPGIKKNATSLVVSGFWGMLHWNEKKGHEYEWKEVKGVFYICHPPWLIDFWIFWERGSLMWVGTTRS